jgi:hypothetical protein
MKLQFSVSGVSARINLTQIPTLFQTENPSAFAKIPRYYQLSIYPTINSKVEP